MDHHGSRIPRRSPRPARRNPRHRIPHAPFLPRDLVPAATVIHRKEAAPPDPCLRPSRRRLGKEKARRQRPGIVDPNASWQRKRSREESAASPQGGGEAALPIRGYRIQSSGSWKPAFRYESPLSRLITVHSPTASSSPAPPPLHSHPSVALPNPRPQEPRRLCTCS